MNRKCTAKIIASTVLLTLIVRGAFADGTVQFQNHGPSWIYLFSDAVTLSNQVTSATLGSQDPGGYGSAGVLDAGLVWGTTTASVSTIYGGTLAGIENIGSIPGQLAENSVFHVVGTVAGNSYYFQVYFWDSSFGDSLAGLQACVASGGYFEAASAGAGNQTYGAVGAPEYVAVGPDAGPGAFLFAPVGLFGKTVILDSPEPGTLLLAGAGGTLVLLFRLRKTEA